MRIDLPQCDFSDCRRRFDGNCNSKEAFRNCKYQRLKTNKTVNVVKVFPESGDLEALYINGILAAEGHSIPTHKIIESLTQFIPISYYGQEISDEMAEMGMPQYLEDLND